MELIPNKKYFLVDSGQFCHAIDSKNGAQKFKPGLYAFIGTITFKGGGKRNIFADFSGNTTYVMFGVDRLDYIEEDHKSVIFKELHKLDRSDPKLEKVLKILNNK